MANSCLDNGVHLKGLGELLSPKVMEMTQGLMVMPLM